MLFAIILTSANVLTSIFGVGITAVAFFIAAGDASAAINGKTNVSVGTERGGGSVYIGIANPFIASKRALFWDFLFNTTSACNHGVSNVSRAASAYSCTWM